MPFLHLHIDLKSFCKLVCLTGIFCCLATYTLTADAADIFKGLQIYNQNCLVCHGSDGKPIVPNAPDFSFGGGIIKSDLQLLDNLRKGMGAMPAYRGIISDEDLLNVIGYLRTLQR